mmetsp:Transcript_3003/g.7682  ORF Transcript_3003/g.7682 Transcript_3003/m.7682 type:complete len:462 (-) Transcript_3003:74-1459(-)
MKPRSSLATTSLALLSHLAVVSAQLHIVHPDGMFMESEGWIYGSTATFGNPLFNERVKGEVLYGKSQDNHCSKHYDLPHMENAAYETFSQARLVVVDRGDCTFVTKVRIAQDVHHAAGVIIIDKKGSTATPKEIQEIVMADDGNGHFVDIPCILISRSEGDDLLKGLEGQRIFAELAWDVPQSEVVRVDYWMSTGDMRQMKFAKDLKSTVADKLMFQMQWVPHYNVFELQVVEHMCYRNNRRHCAPQPKEGDDSVNGEDVAEEDLRQLCIWSVTAEHGNDHGALYSKAWWDYIEHFVDRCPVVEDHTKVVEEYRFGKTCSENLINRLGIPLDLVQACMLDKEEEFLTREAEHFSWSAVGLRVNGVRYRGAMRADEVGKVICRGFSDPPPQECNEILYGPTYSIPQAVEDVMPVLLGAFIVFVCVALQRRYKLTKSEVRDEVMLEVQSQMAEYARLTTPRGR